MTLQKCFSHPSFSYLLFCNPAHKIERGTANRLQLLIANHLDQSLSLANQKQGATVRSHLLHCFLAGEQLCYGFHQPSKLNKYAGEKPFSWAKLAFVDISSSDFNVQGHIVSTGGDSLPSWSSYTGAHYVAHQNKNG